jgi:hypothetical protein
MTPIYAASLKRVMANKLEIVVSIIVRLLIFLGEYQRGLF